VLNAGGSISRSIVGIDDWYGNSYFNNGALNNIMDFANGAVLEGTAQNQPNTCLLAWANLAQNANQTQNTYDVTSYLTTNPAFDFQPDQYYYNFAGHSGKFVLTRAKQAVLQKKEKIQITPASDGSSWQVTTADGYMYSFTQIESYKDSMAGTLATHATAWYLTSITSPNGNAITLSYTPISNFVQPESSWSETREPWYLPLSTHSVTTSGSSPQAGLNPGKQYYGQLLSSINFTNGSVQFSYSASRLDLPGDYRLDSVSIYQTGVTTPMKSFVFTYDYFNGTNDPCYDNGSGLLQQQALRLKLTSVYERGYLGGHTIQNPPYSFSYNETNLPAKTSFARDHWGYFNGVTGRTTLIPDFIQLTTPDIVQAELGAPGTQRDPNPIFMGAFNINKITYPAGGFTTFDFESNDFDEAKSEVNDFSYFKTQKTLVPKNKIFTYDIQMGEDRTSDGDTLDLTNEYMQQSFNVPGAEAYTPVTMVSDFRLTGNSPGITNATCDLIQLPLNLIYFELTDLSNNVQMHVDPASFTVCNGSNGSSCGCQPGSVVFTYNVTVNLPPGKYIWRPYVNVNATSPYFPKLQDFRAIYSWYEEASAGGLSGAGTGSTTNNILTGGGLRILRITDHDGVSEANNTVRKYNYHYIATNKANNGPTEYTYGRRMAKPEYSYFQFSWDQDGGACNQDFFYIFYTLHLMRGADSYCPLNGSAAGAAVGYDQVTELDGENGQFGKKVYQYINNPDVVSNFGDKYSGWNLPLSPPYGSNTVDPNNGSLLEETDYANVAGNFVAVKDVTNQYSTSRNRNDWVGGFGNFVLTTHNYNCPKASLIVGPCNGNQILPYQSVEPIWTFLSQTDEKTYDQLDPAKIDERVTNFFYDNPSHMQLTRTTTTNSKGEQLLTQMQYPLDFGTVTGTDAFSQGIVNLQNRFMHSVPVEKITQKAASDGSNPVATDAVLTTFNSGLPTPLSVARTEMTSPIANFAASTAGAGGLSANAAYQPLLAYDSYDAHGNILQQRKVNDYSTSFLWDYNAGLPVCQVKNAAQSDVAYTSFEADGTGGWTVSGGSIQPGGVTGNNCFSFSGGSISRAGLNSSTTYIVSFWTTNSTPLAIAGSTPGYPILGKRINGWSYFEYQVTGQTSVTLSSTGSIDELRLYPATAQMKTLTYSPLVGVTSECDAGNKIVYYFYDALGRLQYLKDQDGNIVKTFEYHYKGQTSN
jgi:hypothetical protein